ncbi:3'(2'),5'-bisphosphate nucleotidase CysQ [Galbibacter sp. EGI 63066]|uniref:3'(2'),5'-bisphosphate nucleotidase CysQ n=1 Tax=Galbibacter sp. EGI 63066 TaxID=2993559 RepID=UPI0022491311|nr:3'(2'),5'-bisphosphate nucleotidase CysQ [Galbibacter sp. EGI 63066]MCX2680692.1 3'(2'),5'-bisphosphate nucleotidase CysQ [Galbibacter sp. EGI 63066]
MERLNSFYNVAIEAAVRGGKEIIEIYNEGFSVKEKADQSPLTEADETSNRVINSFLKKTGIPIISEENKQIDYSERKNWDECWIVDPLDGTKEFIKKNGEFTVNIALIKKGYPVFGVIYVPVTRELYIGDVKEGKSYKIILSKEHRLPQELFIEEHRIFPSKIEGLIRILGSRSHMNELTKEYIEELKQQNPDKKMEIVSIGSSLKFCLVAEGKADVYPRFAPTMEWDTAAGQAICEAVGLKVIDRQTQKPMKYNRENLLNNYFLVGK